jgi:hypothetical protein
LWALETTTRSAVKYWTLRMRVPWTLSCIYMDNPHAWISIRLIETSNLHCGVDFEDESVPGGPWAALIDMDNPHAWISKSISLIETLNLHCDDPDNHLHSNVVQEFSLEHSLTHVAC